MLLLFGGEATELFTNLFLRTLIEHRELLLAPRRQGQDVTPAIRWRLDAGKQTTLPETLQNATQVASVEFERFTYFNGGRFGEMTDLYKTRALASENAVCK